MCEDDELFEPDCSRCPQVELIPVNQLPWMIYQYCSSQFVSETETYQLVFDLLVPAQRRVEVFEKLVAIHETVREIRPLEAPSVPKSKGKR